VIALGVPSPPFPGRSLDPPIRSRFQIRRIDNPSSEELFEQIMVGDASRNSAANENSSSLAKSCAIIASAMENNGNLFPSNRLRAIWKLMKDFPIEDCRSIIQRTYPIIGKDDFDAYGEFDKLSNLFDRNLPECESINGDSFLSQYVVESVDPCDGDGDGDGNYSRAKVTFVPAPDLTEKEYPEENPSVYAPAGVRPTNFTSSSRTVHTPTFRRALATMIQEHASGNDFLLISPKGEVKTTLTQEFATVMGYGTTHVFAMNTEMTSHDLLLRRSTDPSTGETRWEDSPLMLAARQGELCVLDGIEKLRSDVLSSIQSLMVDRDISLPDGRRVLRQDRTGKHDLQSNGSVVAVHPSFRVIALASMPRGNNGLKLMTPNLMAMFSTIRLPPLTEECLRSILKCHASPEVSESVIDSILALKEELSASVAEECGVSPLSTRNMVQAVRRMGIHNDLRHVLSSIFLSDLLPPRQRLALETVLGRIGISESKLEPSAIKSELESGVVINGSEAKIGSLVFQRGRVQRPEMVPSPNAFDIPAHTSIMHDLLLDWNSGERSFLLLGNQGVGKNKIVDRICEIANWEREYIQLHRDSTIGQLTLTPQLKDGRIFWNDSPLIRAVRDGCALLVDEADKAPVEVVSILKGLVGDGELLLADGRRISREDHGSDYDVIKIHPNFSLWVLANRPGFPFLGNDFFREIGDCFNTRVVNNPDVDSEIRLLSSYAPTLNQDIIHAVASSFSDLRYMSDNGDITYPYSTREAIAVVKHLEKYPEDGLVVSLHNVIDFDSYDEQTYLMLGKVFQKHGITISDYSSQSEQLFEHSFGSEGTSGQALHIEYLDYSRAEDKNSLNPPKHSNPKFGKWDDKNEAHVGGNQWRDLVVEVAHIDWIEATKFTKSAKKQRKRSPKKLIELRDRLLRKHLMTIYKRLEWVKKITKCTRTFQQTYNRTFHDSGES